MRCLFYTFRTNPFLERFQEEQIPLFLFGPLKRDFERFSQIILEHKPRAIIGCARVIGSSRVESHTVNIFGRGKKITAKGQDSYALTSLTIPGFRIAQHPTTSFCNWTVYKTKEFLEEQRLGDIHVSFVHFNAADVDELIAVYKDMQ